MIISKSEVKNRRRISLSESMQIRRVISHVHAHHAKLVQKPPPLCNPRNGSIYLIDTSAAVKNIRCVKLEPLCSASVGRTPAVVVIVIIDYLLTRKRRSAAKAERSFIYNVQSACGRDEY
jgi:hypothetical protein